MRLNIKRIVLAATTSNLIIIPLLGLLFGLGFGIKVESGTYDYRTSDVIPNNFDPILEYSTHYERELLNRKHYVSDSWIVNPHTTYTICNSTPSSWSASNDASGHYEDFVYAVNYINNLPLSKKIDVDFKILKEDDINCSPSNIGVYKEIRQGKRNINYGSVFDIEEKGHASGWMSTLRSAKYNVFFPTNTFNSPNVPGRPSTQLFNSTFNKYYNVTKTFSITFNRSANVGISKRSARRMIAIHEIGHIFGLHDIYIESLPYFKELRNKNSIYGINRYNFSEFTKLDLENLEVLYEPVIRYVQSGRSSA